MIVDINSLMLALYVRASLIAGFYLRNKRAIHGTIATAIIIFLALEAIASAV